MMARVLSTSELFSTSRRVGKAAASSQQPGRTLDRLQVEGPGLAVVVELLLVQGLAADLAQAFLDLADEHRLTGQIGDVLQHDLAADARLVAEDLAVRLDDHHLALDLLLLLRHQLVEEAQGHIDGGHAEGRAVLHDGHGAVGARLGAGVVLVGRSPGALPARRLHAGAVPGLLVVVERLGGVPVGVDRHLAAGVAVEEGAVLILLGALLRQRPDATAEHLGIAILVNQAGHHDIDAGAIEQRDGLGDAARLRFHLGQLEENGLGYFVDLAQHQLLFRSLQLGRDEMTDALLGQQEDHRHEGDEDEGVAGLDCFY